ncbi:hypothetical protein PO909_027702 [Leuciscus waleckii]
MAVWNEASEDALISMIQERPALYDITEKSYANRVAKAEKWREIENKLVISELKKRWDSLRTQYMHYKKQGPSGSSGAQKTGRQQWILNRLQFLEPHTKRNESTSNLTIRLFIFFKEPSADSDSCSPSDGTISDTWPGTHEEPSFIEAELRPSTPLPESTAESTAMRKKPNTPKPPGKRRKMQDESSSEESTYLMRTIGKTLEKLASFCKNLEHRMRNLPPHVLPHFQHEVDDCICKYSVGHNHSLDASVNQYTHL